MGGPAALAGSIVLPDVRSATGAATRLARRPRWYRFGTSESVPIENETSERVVRTMVVGLPPVALVMAGWIAGAARCTGTICRARDHLPRSTGLGITVGFHRLFTHRSFKTTRAVRALLAVCGSMAVEGPVIEWVATHRQHHRFSDHEGDPHSPHLDHAPGWRGALRGLAHAHVGWMFRGKDQANPARYAKDLLADPICASSAAPSRSGWWSGWRSRSASGVALDRRSIVGGLTGLLWGGAVRIFLLHHATFSINSLCHYFGRRPVRHRRRVAQPRLAGAVHLRRGLAQQSPRLPDLRSARAAPAELDPSGWLIGGLERCRLAWGVIRITPERQHAKQLTVSDVAAATDQEAVASGRRLSRH